MKVSLYIPCYNVASFIGECIESILDQDYPVEEVLVIDDGSTDDTARIAAGYPVRVIKHGTNQGLAAARNTAFEASRNDFVAGLDADCRPQKTWLKVLMRSFIDARVAGAGGRLIETFTHGLANKWRSIHMRQHWGDGYIVNPGFLFGSNTVLRRDAARGAGLYDRRYTTNREDYALSLALRKAGYTLVYDPEAVAYHVRQDSVASLLRTQWRWSFFGTAGLRTPDSAYNLACRFYDRSFSTAKLSCEDLQQARFDCAALDVLMHFHHSFADVRYYLNLKRPAP